MGRSGVLAFWDDMYGGQAQGWVLVVMGKHSHVEIVRRRVPASKKPGKPREG